MINFAEELSKVLTKLEIPEDQVSAIHSLQRTIDRTLTDIETSLPNNDGLKHVTVGEVVKYDLLEGESIKVQAIIPLLSFAVDSATWDHSILSTDGEGKELESSLLLWDNPIVTQLVTHLKEEHSGPFYLTPKEYLLKVGIPTENGFNCLLVNLGMQEMLPPEWRTSQEFIPAADGTQ